MAGYSFSHEFYKRWLRAPDGVRAAIVQELKDIITLLKADTNVDDFKFTQPNLQAHLDHLYEQENAKKQAELEREQAALAEQQAQEKQQEKERLRQEILEKQRLERERLEQERLKKQQLQQAEQKQLAEQQAKANHIMPSSDVADDATDNSTDNTTTTKSTSTIRHSTATLIITPKNKDTHKNDDNQTDDHTNISNGGSGDKEGITSKSNNKQDQSTKADDNTPVKFTTEQEAFVHELEMHIDDYLSEQMAQMSENLKAWLREEVKQQLHRLK